MTWSRRYDERHRLRGWALAMMPGVKCLKTLAAVRPDVLTSDVGMPGMDGYALIKAVWALPLEQGGTMPAIVLTAHARSEDRRRAMLSGFDVHVRPTSRAERAGSRGGETGTTDVKPFQFVSYMVHATASKMSSWYSDGANVSAE